MKKKLRVENCHYITWQEAVRHYFPTASDEEVEYTLWEETCYPMCSKTTLDQLYKLYKENRRKGK